MKLLFIIVVCLFNPCLALALETPAQIPLGLNSATHQIELNRQFWFHEDASSEVTIQKVLEKSSDLAFTETDKKTPNFGFSNSAWWGRLLLDNKSAESLELIFTQGYAVVDQIDFWLVDRSGRIIASHQDGDRITPRNAAISYRLPLFKSAVPSGESILYVRVKTEGSVIFDINMYDEASFYKNMIFEYVFLAILLGALLVMALYNMFIWIQLRKVTYLFYIGFIVSMIIQPLAYSGLWVHLVDDPVWLMNKGYVFLANKSSLLALLFPIYFLGLKERHPWLNRLCWFGIAISLLSDAVLYSSYNSGAKISVLTATLVSFITLACGITSSLKRYRPAYFFTLAWALVIFANIVRMTMVSGALPKSFLIEWGVLIGSVVEVILISLALADKIRITEKQALLDIGNLNQELSKEHAEVVSLNSNLERLVEEQTREIKSILQHIQQGILVVKQPHLLVTETHSLMAKALFQTNQIAGSNVIELLFNRSEVTSDVRNQVQSVLDNSLGEGALSFELNAHLLPRSIVTRLNNENRYFQIDWNPVLDLEGRVEKMLVTARDVTELKKLEQEAEEKSRELQIIAEILEVSAKQFGIFMTSAQRFMTESIRLIKSNRKVDLQILKVLMINLHTVKGSARALGLKKLTPLIHDVEQVAASVFKMERVWNYQEMLEFHHGLMLLLDQYDHLNQVKLGRHGQDMLMISSEFIEKMSQQLASIELEISAEIRLKVAPFRQHIEALTFVRSEEIFREVLSGASMLARDLQKECPVIVIHDNGILLASHGQEMVRNAFVHIIRNSMDHGMETAEERRSLGKKPEGRIEVKVNINDDRLEIRYSDDGRGLNLRAIRHLATERGLIERGQKMSLEDIAYLIFEPGFSTCETVNDISGRGVGMSAVKEYIEKENGTIAIRLFTDGKMVDPEYVPFEFVITINNRLFIGKAA